MSRFIYRMSGIALMVVTAVALRAAAEVPNQTPQQLREHASHIVVGKLIGIYHAAEPDKGSAHRDGVVEIVIDSVEKGEGLAEGQMMYARFWRRVSTPGVPPQPSASGHRLPPEGSRVRAHVKRGKDGGYEVLLPNGVVELDAAAQ